MYTSLKKLSEKTETRNQTSSKTLDAFKLWIPKWF